MNAAPGPVSELPKSGDAMPAAVRQQLTEVTRALAQARTALMLIPEQWRPCDDAFILDLARVRNRSADGRTVTDDEKGIIDPIEYSGTLSLHQYELAGHAVELIAPEEHERYECSSDVEYAFSSIGYALYRERFRALFRTKPQKEKTKQLMRALRRVDDLIRDFNKTDFPLKGFPLDELRKWRSIFENIAKTPSGNITRMNAERKRLAIAEAYKLLERYGKPIMGGRGSKFCKLSALLYGYPGADLSNQCGRYRPEVKKSVAK
jgi:hypothetical protein